MHNNEKYLYLLGFRNHFYVERTNIASLSYFFHNPHHNIIMSNVIKSNNEEQQSYILT